MKTFITIRSLAAVTLVFICNLMFSGNTTGMSPDSSLCLRLKGKVSKTHESAGTTYTVELIDNSTVIASQVVKAGKSFVLDARRDRWYGLRVKKSDCVSKLISISTHVPELEEGYMYEIIFEMDEPISEVEADFLDKDAIDFPLALISYEKDMDNFNYSEEYTKNIRTKLMTTILNPDMASSKEVNPKGEAELKNRQALK